MEFLEIINKLNAHNNGSFISAELLTDLPLNAAAKRSGVVAKKSIKVCVRKGIRYSEQKEIKRQVAEEGKVLTHRLPWGRWKAGYEGLAIENNGQDYIRLYYTNVPKESYIINGKTMSFEEAKATGLLVNSFSKSEYNGCITAKCSSIITIKDVK